MSYVVFADLEMSFNLSMLLENVHDKARGPKTKATTTVPSKGKKWARKVTHPAPVSQG